ncbi:hypothetical protein MNBD_GAMMA11-1417 [hydrothermal vent metagenome]|uniref:Uncharacterized protein n=1 Tax=hydrothermal vent metagenome TaxID=652676 RepID=A0A3B0X8R8_9ZZZZ
MDLWNHLSHLFEKDDGSLPDIFVENISEQEQEKIYSWIMSISKPYGNPIVWSNKENRDIQIADIESPVRQFVDGNIESFRFELEGLKIEGILIPQLTICVNLNEVEFDYRMGKEWGQKELKALFVFLSEIKQIAENAKILQADEGRYENPNNEFTEAFETYYAEYIS